MLYYVFAMNYDFNEDYQYDSCVSRGICSVNPRTSSLQEVLLMYLKLAAFYASKLLENGVEDSEIREIILGTISVIVSNPEFSEFDFRTLTERFNAVLAKSKSEYEKICEEKNIEPEKIKSVIRIDKEFDVIKSIRLGEREFLKKTSSIPSEIRDLYKILFVLAKSICINVFDLESFGEDADYGYLMILKLLNSLNVVQKEDTKLKEFMFEVADVDNRLMHQLRAAQEERYGRQRIKDVSYTTTPAKAVLVVGSNIRELEDILEAFDGTGVDVYTHDEMMLANTFPKFDEYKNLKGQFGQGMENCLLDFATFPGPIVLTRHSLYNVEHLYRGLLYTTDFACSKGVIPIKDKDFSPVIKAAEGAKGFKTGRQCESVSIGFDLEEFIENLKKSVDGYRKIVVIGLAGYTLEQQSYFEKFLEQVPDDILVVSLSFCKQKKNVICLNACFDSYAILKVVDGIKDVTNLPLVLIFPKCDRHTMSQMLYLSQWENTTIYVGKCTPIILNPNLINTLNKAFGLRGLSSVRKDLDDIKK